MPKRDPNDQQRPTYLTKQPEEPSVENDEYNDDPEITEPEAELADVVANADKSNTQIASERNIARRMIETCLQEIRNIPRVWEQCSEDEQDEVIHRVRLRCNELVAEVVATVEGGGAPSRAIVEIVSVSHKAKLTDIKLQIKSSDAAVHSIVSARGEQAVLVMGRDPNDYGINRDGIVPDADQRPMFD